MAGSAFRKKRTARKIPKGFKIAGMIAIAIIIFGSLGYIAAKVFPVNPDDTNKRQKEISESAEEKSSDNSSQSLVDDSMFTETALDSAIIKTLMELGVPRGQLKIKKKGEIQGIAGQYIEITARISKSIAMAFANYRIQSEITAAGGSIIDCVEQELGKKIELEIGLSGTPIRKLIIVRDQGETAKGLVALVIDDFGSYPQDESKKFLELGIPFTASVIPFEKYSDEMVRLLSDKKIEIIVHLPMEPEDYPRNDPGPEAIYTNLPAAEIKRRVKHAIDALPTAVGMNNHMGSKATADSRTMEIVADAVYESGLFFIDSRTSIYSCALDKMRAKNIPSTSVDGTIDFAGDSVAIAERLVDLALKSKQTDSGMLIVGHAKLETYCSIKRVLPTLEKWGIEFVPASALISIRTAKQ